MSFFGVVTTLAVVPTLATTGLAVAASGERNLTGEGARVAGVCGLSVERTTPCAAATGVAPPVRANGVPAPVGVAGALAKAPPLRGPDWGCTRARTGCDGVHGDAAGCGETVLRSTFARIGRDDEKDWDGDERRSLLDESTLRRASGGRDTAGGLSVTSIRLGEPSDALQGGSETQSSRCLIKARTRRCAQTSREWHDLREAAETRHVHKSYCSKGSDKGAKQRENAEVTRRVATLTFAA